MADVTEGRKSIAAANIHADLAGVIGEKSSAARDSVFKCELMKIVWMRSDVKMPEEGKGKPEYPGATGGVALKQKRNSSAKPAKRNNRGRRI
jgi:hypothetical protein